MSIWKLIPGMILSVVIGAVSANFAIDKLMNETTENKPINKIISFNKKLEKKGFVKFVDKEKGCKNIKRGDIVIYTSYDKTDVCVGLIEECVTRDYYSNKKFSYYIYFTNVYTELNECDQGVLRLDWEETLHVIKDNHYTWFSIIKGCDD